MKIDTAAVRHCLKSFDFKTLFREHLGWDHHQARLAIALGDVTHALTAVAQKRGFVAFICPSIPDRATRLKIDRQVTQSAREHFVIYVDPPAGQQVWQWVRREPGQPLASRDHRFDASQSGDALIQRLEQIAVSLDEEEQITVVDVAGRARAAFDVDKVTRKFYDRFKTEHAAFLKLIRGIQAEADLQWYTSLMLNRLMFVYFIQKKGFLDGDADYLRNRLARVREVRGRDQFQSFYRYFLLRLFHDGLGKSPDERQFDAALERLLGKVPYLNGGFFEVHPLEERNADLDIPDPAFERLFDFFDRYSWHLDERPLRADNEINPDVVGYIFEKYINQKQMGAYYTKEDITEYIAKNTIIPFLFDAAAKQCPIAFEPDSALWWWLRDDPDRYIHSAVRHGVIGDDGSVVPESALPDFVRQGMRDPSARMADKRYNLQQAPAGDPLRLVTETWREYVCRRQRALAIREKLRQGEVQSIDDFITLNLDIWQFARDAIVNAEGPELLRAFWRAIEKVTVLDPTCGSGAFLFAALRILETLYGDCLERMARFIEDLAGKSHHPKQFSDFREVLEQIAQHPNERYFILKSVIINNLFGVDLMEEAVEICKLRLFLKLVAQLETVGQIEPLPDIDFNIRAGNTLVGYVTLDQVRKSQEGKFGFWEDDIRRIEEDAELVERAFRQFRAQQTIHGGKVTAEDKHELRRRLAQLGAQLDRYLAGEYGVKVEKPKDFDAWRASHEPFHWFIEFYGIMRAGG
ncbi:MAG: SAM-dependent methyltransferase, partial [Candidatus Competibacteraceae bacterium]